MVAVKLREEIERAENESQLVKNINPIISWENFKPPESPAKLGEISGLEGDSEWFFSHTYPTSVIREVLNGIKEKLSGEGPGVFPLDGYLGSGKSHVLLTLYHIFRHPKEAKEWFRKWDIDFPEIEDAIVIPIPLQEITYEDLWTPIFKALGKNIEVDAKDWPKPREIKKAIGNNVVLILIDEIDNWYLAKSSQEQARIRGFLQSLSETAEDSNCQLNLVITFLGVPEAKILRDVVTRPRGGSSIVMQRTEDIFNIVRFRLFENIDHEETERIILDYIKKVSNSLEKKGINANSHLKDELKKAYPFHPAFLKTLSSLKVRQMLVMLARMVLRRKDKTDILITSDLDDDLLSAYLHSVDPKLVDAYNEDISFVKNAKEVNENVIPYELARAILLTSLLNTIETKKGADIKDIIFGCNPKHPVQDIEDTISFLEKWTRLKKSEESGVVRYIITADLPVAVKIERKAEVVPDDEALDWIKKQVEKIVSSAIKGYLLIFDPSDIRNDKRVKILTLLEKPPDVSSIYPSTFTYKNTLFLLYPEYSLKSDETMKLAKRIIASKKLSENEEQKKQYDEFYKDYSKNLKKQIENAGWIVFRWCRKDPTEEPAPSEEPLSNLEDVDSIIKKYSSPDLHKYFIKKILDKDREISISELKERFYRLEGAPILLKEEDLQKSIGEMVKNGEAAVRMKQGRTVYKTTIPTPNDEDLLILPETEEPPTVGEVFSFVKEKKTLSFEDLRNKYPFVSEETLKNILLSAFSNPQEDMFILEDNKVVSKPANPKTAVLLTKDEAAKTLESLVFRIVKERLAVPTSGILQILQDTYGHTGVTEDLILTVADHLEIGGAVNILRKNGSTVVQLPESTLIEEIKKKIFSGVRSKGEIRKKTLIDELIESIPSQRSLFEDAIAGLIDSGKLAYDKETDNLHLPKRKGEPGKLIQERKRLLIQQEGVAAEIVEEIRKEVEEKDVLEGVKIEFEGDLTAAEIKKILTTLGDKQIRFTGRRKEI